MRYSHGNTHPVGRAFDERKGNEGGDMTAVCSRRCLGWLVRDPKTSILRKEVIQPQVPLRLPCYDFAPVADFTVAGYSLAVSSPASDKTNSHGVTGGVYKARERIHRDMLIHDY